MQMKIYSESTSGIPTRLTTYLFLLPATTALIYVINMQKLHFCIRDLA